MAYVFPAASNGSAPLVVPVGGPPGRTGEPGRDSTVPGPEGRVGPAGKDGMQGPAGAGAVVSKTATANVPLWTAIVADGPNGCKPADITDPAQRQQVFAVTAYGGMTGAQVIGQNTGDILGPIAGFEVGDTLFVGDDGALVSAPPTSGWRQAVATVVADGHLVINLGEATQIANDDALIGEGGFATRASPTEVEAGTGDGWTNVDQTREMAETFGGPAAPFTTVGAQARTRKFLDKILDFPLTPLDYMSDAQRAAVRAGTNTADTSNAYEACLLAALNFVDAGDNRAVRVREPAGAYVWNRKVKIDLSKVGKTNGMIIEREGRFASKHYTGPDNKYRFVYRGLYDAAANVPNLRNGGLTPGDCWTVEKASATFNFNGVASVNVGDKLYVRADGTLQKILAEVRYRGYVDLSANNPTTSFGQAKIDVDTCRYGDSWIVESSGSFFGTYLFRGQEIYFLDRNNWRVKEVLNGPSAFPRGEWDFQANGFPSTSGLAAGNYFIVSAPVGREFGPASYAEGMQIELQALRAGDKVGWTGAAWTLLYASPTPRGGIKPGGLVTAKRWRTATNSYEHNNFPLVAGQGAYGDWAYLMHDTSATIAGIVGPHLEDEVWFFGPSGWEKVLRDPNYDVGMLHFTWDLLDHSVGIVGGWSDITTQRATDATEPAENPFNNGVLYRFWGRHSAVSDGGLFSDETVLFHGGHLTHDDASAAEAQGRFGLVEKYIYCRNLYLPKIEHMHGRLPYGGFREPYNPKYPRVGVAGVHLEDCYLPRLLDVQLNARFRIGWWINGLIWDAVDGSSYEGGQFDGAWAECIEGIRLEHGYRKELPCEPTFLIEARDTKSLQNGIVINGHANVVIQGCVPIMEESYKADGTGLSIYHKPAGILIEKADNVVVTSLVVTGGFNNANLPDRPADQNPNWRSTFVLVRGTVGTLTVGGAILAMNAGVGIDVTLAERRGQARDFPGYTPPNESLSVRVNAPSIRFDGYTVDGSYNAFVQGQRPFIPVIDPHGIVATRGINREGGGESGTVVGAHCFEHRTYSANTAFDPILSVDRDRSDFAGFQSGELGEIRLRGKDTSGIRRKAWSVTAQWAGNSTPGGGTTLIKMNNLKGGVPFTFMDANAQTQRVTFYENVQLNAKLFFAAALVDAADDTAAASAGVSVGQTYRSGSALRVRVA